MPFYLICCGGTMKFCSHDHRLKFSREYQRKKAEVAMKRLTQRIPEAAHHDDS